MKPDFCISFILIILIQSGCIPTKNTAYVPGDAKAVANIFYDKNGYRLNIKQIKVDIRFDVNCEIIKSKSKLLKRKINW